jgi:CHASE2 domain-containing sensor protein
MSSGGAHSTSFKAVTGVLFVLAGVACTHLLESHHLLAWPSRALLDALPSTVASTTSKLVTIVTINDDDYAGPFQKQSPLHPEEVAALINAIQSFSPSIIGIDLDTEDWTADQAALPARRPGRLIWARLFQASDNTPLAMVALNKVLGSDGDNDCFGLTAMQPDSDFRIRQYPTEYPLAQQPELAYPSFPIVIQRWHQEASCPKLAPASAELRNEENWDESRPLIRYSGTGQRIPQISAGAVLDTSALAKDDTNNPAVDRMRKALEGRIVLLGGSWKAARDEYPTPVGPLSGVEILGHAVLTALDPKGIAEVRGSTLTWYDLALGLGMVALSLRHPRLATLSNIAIFVLLLFVSGLLFRSFQLFLNTIPVQVSVMLHNLLHPVMHPYLERLLARGKH